MKPLKSSSQILLARYQTAGMLTFEQVITIVDDEIPTLEIDNPSLEVAENVNGGDFVLLYSLTGETDSDVTFDFALTGVSAIEGVDYTVPTNLKGTIAAGDKSGMIMIPITNDNLHEGTEEFTLAISDLTNAVFTDDSNSFSQNIKILDDESPTIEPAQTSIDVAEDVTGDVVDVVVNLSGATTNTVVLTYETEAGTATSPEDFTAVTRTSNTTAMIPIGMTSTTIQIPIIDDSDNEGNQAFKVKFTNVTNAVFASGATSIEVTVTIIDDESPTLSLTNSSFEVAENNSDGNFVVKYELSGETQRDVTFNIALMDGSAKKDSDFSDPGRLMETITIGTTSGMITIPITDDDENEGNEEFTLAISALVGAVFSDGTDSHSQAITIIDDEEPTLMLSNSSFEVAENINEGNFVVNFQLSGETDSDVTLTYTLMDDTTTKVDDYMDPTTPVTISAGSTTASLSIPIVNDDDNEGNETFTLAISMISGAVSAAGTDEFSQTITIIDNEDPEISFDQTTIEVSESIGMANVVVNLSGATRSEVVITYETVDGTAVSPSDFTGITNASPETESIAIGETSVTLQIPIIDDPDMEGNQDFKVKITAATNSVFPTNDGFIETTITIIDNEVPTLTVSESTRSVTEDVENGLFTLTFELEYAHTTQDVTFEYNLTDITTIKGMDYMEPANRSVRIPMNMTEESITIDITDDGMNEGTESFKVDVSSIENAVSSTDTSSFEQIVTITDDEMPTMSITNSTFEVAENVAGGNLVLNFMLTGATRDNVTFNYTLTGTTATKGTDFTEPSTPVSIPIGQTTASLSIPITNDAMNEGNEEFTLAITGLTGAIFSDGTADGTTALTETITIIDDELPAIEVASTNVEVDEDVAGGMLSIPVNLSGLTGRDIVISYITQDDSAESPGDFTGVSIDDNATKTITSGTRSTTIQIPIIEDNKNEGNEEFKLNITNLTSSGLGGSSMPIEVTVTIVDDEMPTMSLTNSTFEVAENVNGGNFVVNFQLSGATDSDVTLTYAFTDGTTIKGMDYEEPTTPVSITAGDKTATLTIPITIDDLHEGNESFTLALSNLTGAVFSDGTDTHSQTITIVDDETPTVRFAETSVEVNEAVANSMVDIVVNLSGPTGNAVVLTYETENGTAKSPSDFAGVTSITKTIARGASTTTIQIPIINDNENEGNEEFKVKISGATNSVFPNGANGIEIVVTIIDDETPTISLSNASFEVDEDIGGEHFVVNVSLSGQAKTIVTFNLMLTGGSAIKDEDFTDPSNLMKTIQIGDTSTTIMIPITDDSKHEGDEEFTLTLSDLVGVVYSDGTTSFNQVITIIDNETPTLEFAETSLEVDEDISSGMVDVIVNLSGPTFDAVVVTYETIDDSAVSPGDFTGITNVSNTTKTIAIGATMTTLQIPIINDSENEGNEEFKVRITNATNSVFLNAVNSIEIVVKIIDDEVPTLSLTNSTFEVVENIAGGNFIINLSLSNPIETDVNFNISLIAGTAIAGMDYMELSRPMGTIGKGNTTGSITIAITDDDKNEGNESFTLAITGLSGAVFADGATTRSHVITILDDELPIVMFAETSLEVNENISSGLLDVVVNLSRTSNSIVELTYETEAGTAHSPNDFTGVSSSSNTTETIAIGMSSTTIQIPIIDDATNEGNEEFKLKITKATNSVFPNSSTEIAITIKIIDNEGTNIVIDQHNF